MFELQCYFFIRLVYTKHPIKIIESQKDTLETIRKLCVDK